ncbi:sialate O-acetylesterase [Mangrovimonas cancribranchiae]|uniref:Sialate O-acetylesterase n=1 Tax=Mangrovimonas cancribranchiae TaxID=3080055 RepID=A0AAU6NXI2_9FLAO
MKSIIILLVCLVTCTIQAEVTLPKLFSEGMVLQQKQDIPVWGWANVDEEVTVQFKNQTQKTIANKDGRWKVVLKPEVAGGPFLLKVSGRNSIVVSDVYVGEVWVCSGQSNMEFTVKQSNNAEAEIANANYPLIRQFWIEQDVSSAPKEHLKGASWSVCSPETVGQFTAAGYFFARDIYNQLNVPIGLINTTWGGTCVETWTSNEALTSSDEFSSIIEKAPKVNVDSIMKIQRKKLINHIETLQGGKLNTLASEVIVENNFNDSTWPEMKVPELWENQNFPSLDGVLWFRKTINISKNDIGKEAVLKLAKIDDHDITYINGVKVGETAQYDADRVYNIPAGVLQEGKNVIAVKVTDYAGGGGIYGNASNVSLTVGSKTYSLAGNWKYNVVEAITRFDPNSQPSLLYNAMLNPIIPYAIKGVLWYQGEANVHRAVQYKRAFPLMVSDWRNQWQQGDFPFYFVQLSSFNEFNGNSNKGSRWAELREAQTYTLETVKNTGMCVTTDIGNATDIHPKNKQDVGKRLAAIALNKDYGNSNVFSGPKFKKMKLKKDKITLVFTDIGSGLVTKNNSELKGFEIAGADKVFFPAQAIIQNGKVEMFSNQVKAPVAVRYGWADDAGNCNLYNKEGFPAVPFRTDNWGLITKNVTYEIMTP